MQNTEKEIDVTSIANATMIVAMMVVFATVELIADMHATYEQSAK